MTDATKIDVTKTDATKYLSHLELGESDKTFLDSNELIINMGP